MKFRYYLILSALCLLCSCVNKYASLKFNFKSASTESVEVRMKGDNFSDSKKVTDDNDQIYIETRNIYFLSAKKILNFQFSKNGYITENNNYPIFFRNGMRRSLSFPYTITVPELTPINYYLVFSLESNPSNAQVSINGSSAGNTPLVEKEYSYNIISKNKDSLRLSVVYPGHKTENISVKLRDYRSLSEARGNKINLKVNLKPLKFYQTIKVVSDIEGAIYYIDDEKIGLTSINKTIDFLISDQNKKKKIRVEHPDYKTVEKFIDLKPKYSTEIDSKSNVEVINFELEPKKFYVAYQLLSVPEGASVSLQETNEYIGDTPSKVFVTATEDRQPYSVAFHFELEGYLSQNKKLSISSDGIYPSHVLASRNPKLLKVHLEKRGSSIPLEGGKAGLNITSDPPNASVEINGKSVGTTDCTIPIDWNSYGNIISITARKSGYREETKSVSNGDNSPIRFVLQKAE